MKSFLRFSVLFGTALLLSGCDWVLMRPSGDIAMQQRDLILLSTGLMLLVIVPVIFLTFFFAWKYRASNKDAEYAPDWHHSTRLELIIWSAPLAIILVLGTVTWIATHKLDPYRPLDRIDANTPIAEGVKPLVVEVVALDWKWLFLYPEQGIATVNELAAPVNVPIEFKITSSSMMNSFFIPALAGQIYAMTGMETKLNAVINAEGVYKGFSGNYSGDGFSHMHFNFHGMSQDGFDAWVRKVQADQTPLGRQEYLVLEKPSEREPVRYFGNVDPALYEAILNMCVAPGSMCVHEMMHIDRSGGGGVDSHANYARLRYDNRHADEPVAAPGATFPEAGREARGDEPQGHQPRAVSPEEPTPQPTPSSEGADDQGVQPIPPGQAPQQQGAPGKPDDDGGPSGR
ncbi:ubiquinol oxidase subunit II [Luteimonas sp. RC10]|jgi:cytochrome o ubiquinol oxidase subunit II|uniref:ubiquinol oxidase subunit II n=1 Tax=Luteimonas sp. RC10 TaxID=2587035 RepID=UPI00160EF93B|nr:ubiquinol oxidase subunit II [Luteimonas sp. RC10]MBB3342949.1 cytochrome o ubiquinol oxidase subunit 2 [Luteimonas sp. RC10]